jgi:uncharacterized protein
VICVNKEHRGSLGRVKLRWHDGKALSNLQKHRVSFHDAAEVFDDPLNIVIDDPDHSIDEDRFVVIGEIGGRRIVVVAYTIRDDEYWLISARLAEPRERRLYTGGYMIHDEDEMRPYYDFSNGVRGKHYRGPRPTTIAVYELDLEVTSYFGTADAINEALRTLIAEGRAPLKRTCAET